MQVGQLLAGDQPEPEVERHRRGSRAYSAQPLADVEVGVLEDVGGIDPAREPAVEPQADHPPQPVAIAVEQRGQGRLVAGQGALEKKPGRRRLPDRTSFGSLNRYPGTARRCPQARWIFFSSHDAHRSVSTVR